MTHTITDIYGKQQVVKCLSCAIGEHSAPAEIVLQTKHFHAEQDFEIPIPGFIIIASNRHFFGIDEMSQAELVDFSTVLAQIRRALRQVIGIDTVYLVHEEDTRNAHFHMWIFPRYAWMEEKFGSGVATVRTIMEYARKELKNDDNFEQVKNVVKKLSATLLGI